jgi:hypothetical protein
MVVVGNGAGSGQWNYGVAISTGGVVQATGSGTVEMHGQGGLGTNWNEGLLVTTSGTVRTNSGTLTITGTARGKGYGNNGIDLNGSGLVKSSASDISLTGNGSGSSNGNSGVALRGGAQVEATFPYDVIIKGKGSAAGTYNNEGVYIDGAHTRIDAGTLSLTGIGAGSGSYNYGLTVSGGAVVNVTDDAVITGTCTATGPNANFGVNITDASTTVCTTSGDVGITGTGSGSGNWDYGIGVQAKATVEGYTVTLKGTGSPNATGTMADGVFLSAARVISSNAGLKITGTAGRKSSWGDGISVNNSQVAALTAGDATLSGHAGTTGHAVAKDGASIVVAPSGKVWLTPDTVQLHRDVNTDGTFDAFRGTVDMTLYSNGNVTTTWHAHDSGAFSYDFQFSALVVGSGDNPAAIAEQQSGHVTGHFFSFGGEADRNFSPPPETVFNQAVEDSFDSFAAGSTLDVTQTHHNDFLDALDSIANVVVKWTVGTVLAPVMPVIFLGAELGSWAATGSWADGGRILNGVLWEAGPTGTLFAIVGGAIAAGASHEKQIPQQYYDYAQKYVFNNTLPPIESIKISDSIGPGDNGGRPFTFEQWGNEYVISLGKDGYDNPMTFDNDAKGTRYGQTLIHELTHVWQMAHGSDLKIFVESADAKTNEAIHGKDPTYTPGPPGPAFSTFGLEQQASIVEYWYAGYVAANHKVPHPELEPLFKGSLKPEDPKMSDYYGYTVVDDTTSPYYMYIVNNIRAGIA